MDDHGTSSTVQEQINSRHRMSRSHHDREDGGANNSEVAANSPNQRPASLHRNSTITLLTSSSSDRTDSTLTAGPSSTLLLGESFVTATATAAACANRHPAALANANSQANTAPLNNVSARGREPPRSLISDNGQSRRGRDSAVGSPCHGDLSQTRVSLSIDSAPGQASHDNEVPSTLEDCLLGNNLVHDGQPWQIYPRSSSPARTPTTRQTNSESPAHSDPEFIDQDSDSAASSTALECTGGLLSPAYPPMGRSLKRSRNQSDKVDQQGLLRTLKKNRAVTAILYCTAEPAPEANDIWPDFRNRRRLPVRYSVLDVDRKTTPTPTTCRQSPTATQSGFELRERKRNGAQALQLATAPDRRRSFWHLPVELVEQILEYLNRDDIKALRLVSCELNEYTSQAAFKTVVVPFNTEIYGMLGQEPKRDRKGKKRAKISRPGYWWKNANGDELYNGHGLDVFRGFGRHILRYGMSFEVNEDALSTPPLKSVTEQRISFWGTYEWPFEEYRRYDAVAGLESAADETPRMKTAFSELTKVKELALSIDSGLGWLHGPDRSIRARVLQASPTIFGSRHHVPDRRTQAQREFWEHIKSMHTLSGEDVRFATLYRLEGTRPVTKDQEASLVSAAQPNLPFLDAHVPYHAIPYDVQDGAFSQSLEGSDMHDRHVLGSPSANAGVLFTSTTLPPDDAVQNQSAIIPAALTKAQKEWLLETEWAQRAFLSSYMLSIIDNPTTFAPIHTLNISCLSDRYLPLLNRPDFWNALPNLKTVTLLVIPGWRTVEKDEAGFVETPRVDPTGQVDTFCALLETHIAPRSNITKLTIGYTASGEHMEGLHARNKLLMPAPVLPLKARHPNATLPLTATATVQDIGMIRHFLLRFGYLQDLTLRNCWLTPVALLQFVKTHDDFALKRLTLDSVSLTAVLRPVNTHQAQVANAGMQHGPPNVAAVQHPVGALWAHVINNAGANVNAPNPNNNLIRNYIQMLVAQLLHVRATIIGVQHRNHISNLLGQLQHLQSVQALTAPQPQGHGLLLGMNQQAPQHNNIALMAQLNSFMTQITMLQNIAQNQNTPVAAPAAASTGVPTDQAGPMLEIQPRDGSWLDMIDQISPGTNLSDFGSTHSQADPNRVTSLQSISFISCGYAKLPNLSTAVDQSTIESTNGVAASFRNPAFTKRSTALAPSMLCAKWEYLGEIVQEIKLSELAALDAGWNLKQGWEDAEAAQAVEFDGLLPGGTGRFSGKVCRDDKATTTQ